MSVGLKVEESEMFAGDDWLEKITTSDPNLAEILNQNFPIKLRIYLQLLRIDRFVYKVLLFLIDIVKKSGRSLGLKISEETQK